MKKAYKPDEVADLFLEYFNSKDIEGLASIYEEDAVVVTGENNILARGKEEIKTYFKHLMEHGPRFENVKHSLPIVNGDIALTSTKLPNGFVTAEVGRKQSDGSWLWYIDQPMIVITETKD
ncbi:YybH family protein [Bacteroides reticulotermitis]|uniref:SnoaL-like domain-containing protein n=2 Tax=Bacteroides reticulotermitis TaxID=1133319 RepID=W4UVI7_9BACE|nr:nuclear transport factor 2 family protein [Bacteroides reticulotermitis]MBB4045796.1 ketosteroid isomerase-like protein [Bacteroides reticulotermitis]GAE84941.1 hypothetical protein JCM10512_3323 [Bacteroides reticulotermitis JCM 10512]